MNSIAVYTRQLLQGQDE